MKRAMISAAVVSLSLFALDAASIAQMTQKDAPESQGRRICRYQGETGWVAARRRVCLTRAEWERVGEEQRKASRHLLDGLDSCANRAEGGPCNG